MKWKEILTGVFIYALALTAGYSLPLISAFIKNHCGTLIAFSKAEKTLWRTATLGFGMEAAGLSGR